MPHVEYLHFLMFFVSVVFTLASKKMENYAGGRSTHFVDDRTDIVTLTTNSMIQCAIMCTATVGCCTIGYKKSTKECKMNFDCCPAIKFIKFWKKGNEQTETDWVFQKIPIKDNAADDRLKDCSDLSDGSPPGVYTIHPSSSKSLDVYCDNGWTVIQRHNDPAFSFVRRWDKYKAGFGNVSLDHWLGNDNIHLLTSNNRTCGKRLKLVLSDWNGDVRSGIYNIFYIGDDLSKYKPYVSGGSGDFESHTDNLGQLTNYAFSTIDRDNDVFPGSCAQSREAGWWFSFCGGCCLNGRIQKGLLSWNTLHWHSWHNDPLSLKSSLMLIK